ncbi:MAG: hypothetical protein FWC64_02780 [Treponema sp.]|nr:hypothetical protein [Treponema sp.]
MVRKTAVVLGLLLLLGGAVLADDSGTAARRARNSITIEIAPAAAGLFFTGISHLHYFSADDAHEPAFAFGTAVQYERELTARLSAAGRFAYGIFGEDWSVSVEAHGRFYPRGMLRDAVFFSLMVGYAAVFTDLFAPAHESPVGFLKYGGRVGVRNDFGNPRGFVMEVAAGINGGIGPRYRSNIFFFGPIFIDPLINLAVRGMHVSGPRLSVNVGWRF